MFFLVHPSQVLQASLFRPILPGEAYQLLRYNRRG